MAYKLEGSGGCNPAGSSLRAGLVKSSNITLLFLL